jgi:glycosyltransferase involved in cell wall biosynthesis
MPRVAIIGSRGYPSFYGGFETAVRYLAPYLAENGWDVTVFGRPGDKTVRPELAHPRVTVQESFGIDTKSLGTLSHGASSAIAAAKGKFDCALVMNVANGYWLPILKGGKVPTLVNVDGIEWDRAKWGYLAKKMFWLGAKLTAKYADDLVFDAQAIGSFWSEKFGRGGHFIAYGGQVVDSPELHLGLERRKYALLVARLVPENSIQEFFDAIPEIRSIVPVVIVGTTGFGGGFDEQALALSSQYANVHWLRHVSDEQVLNSLWHHAGMYFHGHTVGGTNPALVQAMACGAPILASDTVYNREVLGSEGYFTDLSRIDIVSKATLLLKDENMRESLSTLNRARASELFTWEKVCFQYERALRSIVR